MQKNIPVVSFLARTWMLLVFVLVSNFLTLWNHAFVWVKDQDGTWRGLTLFNLCGSILYVPGLASAAVFVALFMIHLFFRQTLDQDAHDGTYVADWRALTPVQRIYAAAAIRVGVIIAIAIIAASMGK